MLSDIDFENIHAATVGILEDIGFHVPEEEVLRTLKKAGIKVEETRQCVKFSVKQIEDAISQSPKEVRLYHRPADRFVSCHEPTKFMPSGSGLAVFDPMTGERRESKAADVRDLIRIQEKLPNVDVVRPMVTALDYGDDGDLVECYLALRHSGKPFLHRTLSEKNARVLVQMGVEVMGSEAELRRMPPFAVVYCPISPLSIAPEAARCILFFAEFGVPVLILAMSIGGATAPVTLQGQVLLINVEVLAGITMIQTLFPGAPVLYGSVASVLDMKTAVLALGAPERGLLGSWCAELAGRYGIPSVLGGLSSDAKDLDEQAGYEKALTALPLMGKASMIFGMGVLDSANTYSFEQLVLDDEMIGGFKRLHRGIRPAELAEEISLIKEIGWSGEYLSTTHTFNNFRRNWQPQIMSRDAFDIWFRAGKSLKQVTRAKIAKLLDDRESTILESSTDKRLRDLLGKHGLVLKDNL